MANRFWVGGTATWDGTAGTKWATTSGGAGGASAPTNADDVFFDGSSGTGTVTLSSASAARSVDCNGFAGTWSHPAATTLGIGDGTAGSGNRILRLATTMTYTLGNANTSAIQLNTTSGTQQTVTTNGKTVGNFTINGAGGNILLSDSFTSSGTLTHNAGTFDTGSQTISVSSFNTGTSTTRTLTLGSSAITCTSSAAAWTGGGSTGLTVSANTAVVTLTATLAGANNIAIFGFNFNGISFVLSGGVTAGANTSLFNGGGTIANLTINGTATKNNRYLFGGNLTITGTLTATSNSDANNILIASNTRGTSRTLTAATLVCSNRVDFMDITGAGAATWTVGASGASYFGDAGGNSGITFTTPATQTISSGNWDNAANWTSRIPLPQDDVVLTGSSAITLNMQRFGRDIDMSAYTGTLTLTSTAETYDFFGSVIIGSGMSWGSGPNTFNVNASGRGTHTITSNGKQFFPAGSNQTFSINGFGGSYTLSDALDQRTPTTSSFSIIAGTFVSNNHAMDIGRFTSTGSITRSADFGTSTVNIYASGGIAVIVTTLTGFTLSADNAVFTIVNSSASTRSIDLSGQSIGTFTYTNSGSTGPLNISSSGTIRTLNFSDASNARILQISAGVTLTCYTFNVFGTASKLMTVKSASTTTARLSKPSGGVITTPSLDYVAFEYIHVVQAASLWLNANSSQSNCINIYATEPTYKHKQSAANVATATSVSQAFPQSTTAGNLLVMHLNSSGTQGASTTPPAGWTLGVTNSNSSVGYFYYKIADGTETTISYSQTTSRTLVISIIEYYGFSGTPTLDVTDSNNSGIASTSLSTTASTGPTNSAQPALALAVVGAASTLASITSITNGFTEDLTEQLIATNASITHLAHKELTTLAAVETTFNWTTSRASTTALLIVFIDVITFRPQVSFVD